MVTPVAIILYIVIIIDELTLFNYYHNYSKNETYFRLKYVFRKWIHSFKTRVF